MDGKDYFDYSRLEPVKKAPNQAPVVLSPFQGAAGQTFWLGPDEADSLEFEIQKGLENLRADSTNNAA